MDTVTVDHEKRLTRLEDRLEFTMPGIMERLQRAEGQIARIDALNEALSDLTKRVAALEAAQPQATQAATIGLAPGGA